MRLILGGILMATTGLGLLLAQAARAIEPGILLALLSFAVAFVGILLGTFAIWRSGK